MSEIRPTKTVIIKWDIKQLEKVIKVYYKVHQVLQSVTEVYYKVCQVLQSVTWGYCMVGRILFDRSLKIYFIFSFLFENLVDNRRNWYYKVRQKTVIKKSLLKIASGITKYDRSLLQSVSGVSNVEAIITK